MLGIVLIVLSMVQKIQTSQVRETTHDQRLKEYIYKTNNYNWNSLPVNGKINLQISISFQGIVSIDQITNSVKMKIVMRVRWIDQRLQWDPTQFGNITLSTFDTETQKYKIWTPDMVMIQADGKLLFPELDKTYAQVDNNGNVYWSRPGKVDLTHKFQLKEYPFDVQRIVINCESWSLAKDKLEILEWKNDPSSTKKRLTVEEEEGGIQQHLQWNLTKISYKMTTNMRQLQEFSSVYVQFDIQRKGYTTVHVMYIPGILVSFLSLITFFIKIEDPLRVQFTTTTLLTLIMFLVMITRFLPITNDKPIMEVLFANLVVIVFSVDVFVILCNFYQQKYNVYLNQYNNNKQQFQEQQLLNKYKKLKKVLQNLQKIELQQNRKIDEQFQRLEDEDLDEKLKRELTKQKNQQVSEANDILFKEVKKIKQRNTLFDYKDMPTIIMNKTKTKWQHIQKKYIFKMSPQTFDLIGFILFFCGYIIYFIYTIFQFLDHLGYQGKN